MGEVVRIDRWEGAEPDPVDPSPPSGSAEIDIARRDRWVERETVRLLYGHPIALYIAGFAVAAIGITVLWPQVARPIATGWLVAVALLAIAQVTAVQTFRRRERDHQLERWGYAYLGSAALAGGAWGFISLALFPSASLPHQSFVMSLVAGVTATALPVLAPSRWAFPLFATAAVLPLVARLATVEEPLGSGMAAIAAVFLITLLMLWQRIRQTLVAGLEVRYESGELQSELLSVNEGLIVQIEGRKQADRELEERDMILEAVSFAGERLLHSKTSINDPQPILARLGEAARASRASLITLVDGDRDLVSPGHHSEWCRDAAAALPRQPPFFPAANPRWVERLRRRRAIAGSRREFTSVDRAWLERWDVRSLAVLPVFADQRWWGLLVFEDQQDRSWSKTELEALATAADILGAAVHRVDAEAALASSDSRYQMLANNTNDVVGLHDIAGRFVYVSPSCLDLLNYRPEDLLGKDLGTLCSPEERRRIEAEGLAPARRREASSVRWLARRRDGETRWVETITHAVEDASGDVGMLVTSTRDITGHKETEDQLFHEQELAHVTLRSIGDGVITTADTGGVRFLNPIAERLTGWTNSSARGRSIERIFNGARSEDQARVTSLINRCRQHDRPVQGDGTVRLLDTDGQELTVEVSCAPIHDQDGQTLGQVVVLRDVTHNQRLAAQLTYQASHDALTGLLNRREFEVRLGELVAEVTARISNGEAPISHALCYLDLDQFKVINDTCGHIAGDELLRQISKLLRAQLRHSDIVARLGGDEFGVLLRECPVEKAIAMAEQLCRAMSGHRFTWQDHVFRIGASVGVVEVDASTTSESQILSAADAACYVAKDNGRGRVHLLRHDDGVEIHTGEMRWISAIHSALEADRFLLRYQPIVAPGLLAPGPERVEILLTMVGPDGVHIAPGRFIPAAERFNVMGHLDRWVVRNCFAALAGHWRNTHSVLKQCFINLSGASLADESFLSYLKELIVEHRVPAGTLCFEITETAAIANLVSAATFMRELRDLGCQFALDDFGSGLSSFGYLRSLPVDYLKIDGTFVRDLATDAVDLAIVESIHNVGRQLRIKTIAECVESEEALAKLMLLGVDLVQGYAIAPPAPLAELLATLGPVPDGSSPARPAAPHSA